MNLEQRSTADRRLLQTDPDKAMRAVGIWADWDDATPEQQALDHQWVESWRNSAGYSGGDGGMDWKPLDRATADAGTSFGEEGLGSFDFNDPAGTATHRGSRWGGERPVYDGGGETSQAMLDALQGYGEFSYDPATDPLYGAYKKAYVREGQRAEADALAQAAALTGGIPSSYAVGAADQAGNYYASQLADRIPELEARAYQRWAEGYDRALSDYRAAADADDRAYNRYLNELAQYNTDRAFDYGVYSDEFERARQAAALGDFSLLENLGLNTDAARGTVYAYGDDGTSYSVGSYKGQFFLNYAPVGSTMTGGDGSVWVKNADGSVTITTKDGKTFAFGGNGTGGTVPYYGPSVGANTIRQGAADVISTLMNRDDLPEEQESVVQTMPDIDVEATVRALLDRGADLNDVYAFISSSDLSAEERRRLRNLARSRGA